MIGALLVVSIATVIPVCALVAVLQIDPEGRSFAALIWASLMLMLDAGSLSGDSGFWPFDIAMFLVIMGGIFVMSTLIGVITTCIGCKLDELRKGRSHIVETGHTVILGWSPQVFRIIGELVNANDNQKRACVVILAPKDRTEMEDEIRERLGKRRNTRIVCRTGNPIDPKDLDIVRPQSAKSIIVVSPTNSDPDVHVIKVVLALTNNPEHSSDDYHIVASVRSPSSLQLARMVGGHNLSIVSADEVAARIAAQVCRQSGLSVVWTDLLDFAGDEIYFQNERNLLGKTYAEVLHAYDRSSVIGIRLAEGHTLLNPPMEQVLQPGDLVIAISEDDDTVILSGADGRSCVDEEAIHSPPLPTAMAHDGPVRLLVIGWNHRGAALLREVDHYVASGSTVTVLTESLPATTEGKDSLPPAGRGRADCADLRNLACSFRQGRTTDRFTLDQLDISSAFDHVVVLSDMDHLDAQEADARTLMTLLHLRDIAESCSHRFSIVSEILDGANRYLAQATHADDFIISDELISLLLTQISERRELSDVFEQLLDADGAEIYLKPIEQYVSPDRPITFYTALEAAARRGETAIGYRVRVEARDPKATYGVHLNPAKSDPIAFSAGDCLIVLAEQ